MGALLIGILGGLPGTAQQRTPLAPDVVASRNATEAELESIAVIDRKVMVPMRDGKRMATDIYRPKDGSKKYPIIFVRTPYNFNYWDVRTGAPRDMRAELDAVKRGYAYVEMNERGHFFSEGNYDILGAPLIGRHRCDLRWMSSQPWSNGKVGTIGCSSTAEWQLGVAALGNPAFTTMIPQGFGAGVGRVGPYYEQGNWYRGGAVQMLFIAWIYGEQNQVRPMFPPNTSQEDLIRASKAFDLAQHSPPVDWAKALRHLPEKDIIKAVGRTARHFRRYHAGADRRRHDQAHAQRSGLVSQAGFGMTTSRSTSPGSGSCPGMTCRSARTWPPTISSARPRRPEIANQQYAVIAPTLHCGYKRATEHTIVGERNMGDARLDYDALTYGWFDHFLKGEDNDILEKTPKVQYFTMGLNKWQTFETLAAARAEPMTFYLGSGGKANSLYGDGALTAATPAADKPDSFIYDPMNPVPSYGGNVCCTGNAVTGGALDQRKMEARAGHSGLHVRAVERRHWSSAGRSSATLYVSSDAKDTDFTVKIIDVLSGRHCLQPGRDHPAPALSRRLRQAAGLDGKGQSL